MVFKPILMILQLKTSIFKGFYHCESSKFSPAALKNIEQKTTRKNNHPREKKPPEKKNHGEKKHWKNINPQKSTAKIRVVRVVYYRRRRKC